MNKLFVYGIFLDEGRRKEYGMTNPQYDTVLNHITIGDSIVTAVPVAPKFGTALTGLLVDMYGSWEELDALERAYNRIKVTTDGGVEAYMYVQKGVNDVPNRR